MAIDFQAWDAIQLRAKSRIWRGLGEVDCLAAAAPTGFGKTRLGANLIKEVQAKGYKWVWYTHRKTLTTQTLRSFQEQGLDFGVRASGLPDLEDVTKLGQIAMIQSERAATKSGKRQLHDAKFVVIDESHANKTGFAEELIRQHLANGAKVLQLSATPVGQGHISQKLVELATLSEMRKIGALLPAECFSPTEFDMKDIKKIPTGDYSPTAQARIVMQQQVVGDIIKHYYQLNPKQYPTIGFGPDVKSSIGLCDKFNLQGIKAAHVDGQDVYLGEHNADGTPVIYKSSQKMRDYVFDAVKAGDIKIIWNRFVMREGVDIPSLGCAIFACAFGAPETWVQAVGRILRADPDNPELGKVIVIDHGGNCHRAGLGSPNADREWELHATNKSIVEEAKKERKDGKAESSVRCPNCFREIDRIRWASAGNSCPVCHHQFRSATRMVHQTDGKLKKLAQPKDRKLQSHSVQKEWDAVYFPSMARRSRGSNFDRIADIVEMKCTNYRIDREKGRIVDKLTGESRRLGNCPMDKSYWKRSCKEVPRTELRYPEKF